MGKGMGKSAYNKDAAEANSGGVPADGGKGKTFRAEDRRELKRGRQI
jgi:hypothetical protein